MKTVLKPRTFRPWPENQERLEFAEKLDLNVSEIINEILKERLRPVLEQKTRQLREALSAPIP
jgi:hypothetical protein